MLNFLIKKLRAVTVNYVTTILGVGVIMSACGSAITTIFTPGVPVDFSTLSEHKNEIMIGIGLIIARDADKSSKVSGAV